MKKIKICPKCKKPYLQAQKSEDGKTRTYIHPGKITPQGHSPLKYCHVKLK